VNRENVACGQSENFYCPFIPATSHLVTAHLDFEAHGQRALKFPLHMLWKKVEKRGLERMARQLNVSLKQVRQAAARAELAQQAFYAALRQRGRAVLANLKEDEFVEGMFGLLDERRVMYETMMRNIYGLGLVLRKKFALLQVAYTAFMLALVTGVLSFIAVFIWVLQQAPA